MAPPFTVGAPASRSFDTLSRRPKKRLPFHLVPVIAVAAADRLGRTRSFQAKPFATTVT